MGIEDCRRSVKKAQQGARANDHGCHVSCSEQHEPRQPRSWLILNVGRRMITRWLQPDFDDSFPVACIMKHRLPKYWIRIHSLSGSKRYPESNSDRKIVLERYALFGTAILGEQAPC